MALEFGSPSIDKIRFHGLLVIFGASGLGTVTVRNSKDAGFETDLTSSSHKMIGHQPAPVTAATVDR